MRNILLLASIVLGLAGLIGIVLAHMPRRKGLHSRARTISFWLLGIGIGMYLLVFYGLGPTD